MKEAISALKTKDKQQHVQVMFSSCAKRYDFTNSLLSGGMHHHWKKIAIKSAGLMPGDKALDVCSGTQDMAILMSKYVGCDGQVVSTDLNAAMLEMGDQKVAKLGLSSRIKSLRANAQDLPLPDNEFDVATVAFGIRNVDSIEKAFCEMRRVLKPGGKLICLEFSTPVSWPFKIVYDIYSFAILPTIGPLVSGDRTGIYYYLPKSIRKFPPQKKLKKIMEQTGLRKVTFKNLCGGIVAIHSGIK